MYTVDGVNSVLYVEVFYEGVNWQAAFTRCHISLVPLILCSCVYQKYLWDSNSKSVGVGVSLGRAAPPNSLVIVVRLSRHVL